MVLIWESFWLRVGILSKSYRFTNCFLNNLVSSSFQPLLKPSPWSNHQNSGWSTGNMSWGSIHARDHRRTGNTGIPGTMNQISPLKKPFSGNVIAPPKFTRSTPSLTPKSWIEDNVFRTDSNSNTLLPLQVRMVCNYNLLTVA